MKLGHGTATRCVLPVLAIVAVLAGCDDGSGSATATDETVGVLEVSDLEGDGWVISDEGGGTLCGGLSSMIESMFGVAEGSEIAFQRGDVTVISQVWIESPGSGSRRADFDRVRSHANQCGAVEDVGDHGLSEFEIVDDEPDSFVVHERRTISGVEGGADQLYFREGSVVGRVVVAYEGDVPQLDVTDLEEVARSRATELAEIST